MRVYNRRPCGQGLHLFVPPSWFWKWTAFIIKKSRENFCFTAIIWPVRVTSFNWSSHANVRYLLSNTYVSIIDVKHMDFFRRCDAFYTRSVPEHKTTHGQQNSELLLHCYSNKQLPSPWGVPPPPPLITPLINITAEVRDKHKPSLFYFPEEGSAPNIMTYMY